MGGMMGHDPCDSARDATRRTTRWPTNIDIRGELGAGGRPRLNVVLSCWGVPGGPSGPPPDSTLC